MSQASTIYLFVLFTVQLFLYSTVEPFGKNENIARLLKMSISNNKIGIKSNKLRSNVTPTYNYTPSYKNLIRLTFRFPMKLKNGHRVQKKM